MYAKNFDSKIKKCTTRKKIFVEWLMVYIKIANHKNNLPKHIEMSNK